MSRAEHLQGEHLLIPTARFLRTSDAGGGFARRLGVTEVVRAREPGEPLTVPARTENSTQLLWVVSGGAVAPTACGSSIPVPTGSFVALGNRTTTDGWRAGSEGATVLAFRPPEPNSTVLEDLAGVVQMEPDMSGLLAMDLEWRGGQDGCRRAVLGTNGNLMTVALLSFGQAIRALPPRTFPRGEIWVMLWGSAEISGRTYSAGQVGAVGPGTVYAPENVAADTLVLVYTPQCPKAPQARDTAPWAEAASS